MKLNWADIPKPIIALSPMADMTDSAFCRTIKDVVAQVDERLTEEQKVQMNGIGQPIVFREMVSSQAIVRGNNKTLNMTDIHPAERPLVQQIFGSDPDVMAVSAKIIMETHAPEGIDINMGCPVYKLVHDFNGAALMKEPELASEMVRKVKAAVDVPVSVKIRAGWDNPKQCLEFSKILEQAGADLITVHARTKKQGYAGASDWDLIKEMKAGVSIPVLANGDIHTSLLTFISLEQTKADGVLIARGALGNPWIFSQIKEILAGLEPTPTTMQERVRVIKKHLDYHIELYGEGGIKTFRKHLVWYLRGIPGIKPFKIKLHTSDSKQVVHEGLQDILDADLEGLSSRDATHPDAAERTHMTK